jgi:DNA (cytosine-5)-methyltransferase 1
VGRRPVRRAEAAEGPPYKAIVVENVVDAFKWGYDDDGGLFNAWLQAMRALGYEHEIVWLNSMFCPPTPQSRDRMYVVFWRGDPPAEPARRAAGVVPALRAIVDGRQTWKKPGGRVWGRYGASTSTRARTATASCCRARSPAATIIDWELPAS